MFKQNIDLIIERDNCSRVVRRTENIDGETTIKTNLYNNYGDLIKMDMKKNDVTFLEEIYDYEYDEYKNKKLKIVKIIIDSNLSKSSSTTGYTSTIYHYINEYEDGKLIKKTCQFGDTILYMNQYYYHEVKLTRIERYNRPPRMELWRTELVDYEYNKVIKSIYLANGIISHYVNVNLMEGVPIKKTMTNPAKGKCHWEITYYDSTYCSVYVGESKLNAEILLEILGHIEKIKEMSSETITLLIECSDTMVNTSDMNLYEIETSYMERGISIQYVP